MKTYRVLSALLSYPTAEMVDAAPEMSRMLAAENIVPMAERRAIERLLKEFFSGDLLDLQERYVSLFDRVPSLSLHLFGHVHGDSRDRGSAMVDLIELYRGHGFEIVAPELSDFVPLFLEFLGQQPPEEARRMLGDIAHILVPIQARLAGRASAYAAVLAALLAIAGVKSEAPAEVSPDEDSFEAIDRAWEEREVRFGAGDTETADGCSQAAAMVRRMNAEVPGAQP